MISRAVENTFQKPLRIETEAEKVNLEPIANENKTQNNLTGEDLEQAVQEILGK